MTIRADFLAHSRISAVAPVALRSMNGHVSRRTHGLRNACPVGSHYRTRFRTAIAHFHKGTETVDRVMHQTGIGSSLAQILGLLAGEASPEPTANLNECRKLEGKANVRVVLPVMRYLAGATTGPAGTRNGCNQPVAVNQLAEAWQCHRIVRPRTAEYKGPSIQGETAKDTKQRPKRVTSNPCLRQNKVALARIGSTGPPARRTVHKIIGYQSCNSHGNKTVASPLLQSTDTVLLQVVPHLVVFQSQQACGFLLVSARLLQRSGEKPTARASIFSWKGASFAAGAVQRR